MASHTSIYHVYVCIFCFLCVNTPQTYPWHIAKNTLDESFGADWATKLKLEKEPVGAGCIAQVYRGELLDEIHEGNTEKKPRAMKVAVKLIHPHVRKQIDVVSFYYCDFCLLYSL